MLGSSNQEISATALIGRLTLTLFIFIISTFVRADTIKIGVRAHIGIEKSTLQWKKTIEYLSKKIPEHKFEFIPVVSLKKLLEQAVNNKFDFVITNPSSFVEMEVSAGATALLTLRNKRQGNPYNKFGAVIFTRKENTSIYSIHDLEDKTIVAVSEPAFGGWRVAQREMLLEGFPPYQKAKKIIFSGGIQQNVVEIVQLGNAEVGVVRTDMLERMASSGDIDLNDFRIINEKKTENFPFYHSTKLYPEWAFVKMQNTSSEISKKVTLALLTMPANAPAAIVGKYVGWGVSEDYQPVHNLMKELKIGGYQNYYKNPFEYFFSKYLIQIIVTIIILVCLFFSVLYVLTTNRRLVSARKLQNKLMGELEERVIERTDELLKAKEVAEKSNNAKTEFLSRMSHELRTPMNAVLGFAQLLQQDVEQRQLTEVKENVEEILISGRHMLDLVNDILDFSRIEDGKFSLELTPVLAEKLINKVIHLLKSQAEEKEITIHCEFDEKDEIEILVDLRSTKQVLINLMLNAIKYNHIGGNIIIEISEVKNSYCKISITDNGDGIEESALAEIFDPFERMTKRTTVEGSGVGLAISKSLVEAMGGEIQVESIVGTGSTFSLLFKLVH